MRNNLEDNEMVFKNKMTNKMDFEEVLEHIRHFMKMNPMGKYKLIIGTDSQVRKEGTLFISAVVIHREGDGAWACRKPVWINRHFINVHEKISTETSLSEELVFMFENGNISQLEDIIMPYIYDGSSLEKEVHLDIGDKIQNKTREYVNEMVSRVESMGFKAVIKPDAVVASGYANRFTKAGR